MNVIEVAIKLKVQGLNRGPLYNVFWKMDTLLQSVGLKYRRDNDPRIYMLDK